VGTTFKTKQRIEARRATIARMVLVERLTQMQIAERLGKGISQATISRDLKVLRAAWREEASGSMNEIIQREKAELEAMETDIALHLNSDKLTHAERARYVDLQLKIKKRKSDLLGLDAPDKHAWTDAEGKTQKFSTLNVILPTIDNDNNDNTNEDLTNE